jgi:hypothetical protein
MWDGTCVRVCVIVSIPKFTNGFCSIGGYGEFMDEDEVSVSVFMCVCVCVCV